ncbi:hypothetical protein HQ585_08895 [candidate division KSB1 bacterium]|nr:hypothetical protein [candidate division KSB1 bacterium]
MIFRAIKRYNFTRYRVYLPVLIIAFYFGLIPGLRFSSALAARNNIQLISPGSYEHLYTDSIAFQWMHRPVHPDSIQHYEIQFWSTSQFFRQRERVSKYDSETGYFQYSVSQLRQTFRRHGQYFWRVSVIDLDGRLSTSDTRTFFIPTPEMSKELSPWFFPFEIQWQSVQPIETPEYLAFLQEIQPASHLQEHSNISLIFRQDQLLNNRFRLMENVFVHSRVGLGGEFSAHWRMMRNRFISVYPNGRFQISKFSTGIGPYATLQYDGYLGASCEIMPQSLIIISGGWIPIYHVRYQSLQGNARRFSASGWEVGVRLLIPKSIIKPFTFLGLKIDLQRFPIEYQHRQVLDSFSDLSLQTRSFGIGFLFR